MTLRPFLAALTLFLLVGWAVSGHGEQSSNKEVEGGGLTRDSLYQPDPPAPTPRSRSATTTADARPSSSPHHYKYTVQVEPQGSRHRSVATARQHSSSAKPLAHHHPPRRGPVVRFVYWWNGWVLRTFHTKFGTVLLRSVGAQQTVVES